MRIAFLGNFDVDYSSESHHAKSLEALGHTVDRLQEGRADAAHIAHIARTSDMLVWVHTHGWHTQGDMAAVLEHCREHHIPTVTYHLDLYMPIPGRWRQYQADPYMGALDHFFTVDACLADWLTTNTTTVGHYLPPGVYGDECYISDQPSPHANDVVFVGSKGYHPEYPMRPKLVDWLHATYGDRFTHAGGGGRIGTVRGDDLNRMYARSKVVVGDSYISNPYYRGKYWSDRVPETLGRGGMLLHPWVYGLDQHFIDGEHLITYPWGDFDYLRDTIDYFLEYGEHREQIRKAGHEHVRKNHTYTHRWQTILDTVFG